MNKTTLSSSVFREVVSVVTETQEEAARNPNQFVKLRDTTIDILVKNGIENLPMLERRGHVRENILTELEAIKLGFSIKNKRFHGLGVKIYLDIINSLDNPVAVYQYIDDKNHFIIETSIEINGIKSVVPIMIKQQGIYNNVRINFNKIRTTFFPNKDYISRLIEKGKIKEVFTGDEYQQATSYELNIP